MPTKTGFNTSFIGPRLKVELPKLSADQKKDVAPVTGASSGELTYLHFSIFLSKKRRFPFYTATNVDGSLFKKAVRSDQWKIDQRAAAFQWGNGLYTAPKSDFDKGHMTKREDPQWGDTAAVAQNAADDTFHFSNSVPQIPELNRHEWKQLEDYILEKESVASKLLINVFTGPVLKNDDPVFVSKVDNQDILIPSLFWKVIFYTNDGKTLNKVGFLMGQENMLEQKGIVRPARTMRMFATHLPEVKKHFMDFTDAETYQVNLSTIEKLSGLKFAKANEPYTDKRPSQLVIKQVEMKDDHHNAFLGSPTAPQPLHYANYRYEGIVLR